MKTYRIRLHLKYRTHPQTEQRRTALRQQNMVILCQQTNKANCRIGEIKNDKLFYNYSVSLGGKPLGHYGLERKVRKALAILRILGIQRLQDN